MLVLSRKLMERIQIGDSIVVTVLAILGNRVQLGLEVPRAIPVLRAELMKIVPGLPSRVMPPATT